MLFFWLVAMLNCGVDEANLHWKSGEFTCKLFIFCLGMCFTDPVTEKSNMKLKSKTGIRRSLSSPAMNTKFWIFLNNIEEQQKVKYQPVFLKQSTRTV